MAELKVALADLDSMGERADDAQNAAGSIRNSMSLDEVAQAMPGGQSISAATAAAEHIESNLNRLYTGLEAFADAVEAAQNAYTAAEQRAVIDFSGVTDALEGEG